MSPKRFLRCLLFLLFSTALAFGQSSRITGIVTDPSGAVAPGATVTLKNVDTGLEQKARNLAGGSEVEWG